MGKTVGSKKDGGEQFMQNKIFQLHNAVLEVFVLFGVWRDLLLLDADYKLKDGRNQTFSYSQKFSFPWVSI